MKYYTKQTVEKNNRTKISIGNVLLLLIMIEVFTGGGGGLYSFHVLGIRLTARIILFVILIIHFILTSRGHLIIKNNTIYYVYILFIYNLFSCLIGCLLNDINATLTSFLSTLYLIAYAPIINLSKERNASFSNVYRILLMCSTIISSFTLLVYALVNFKIYSVIKLRNYFDSTTSGWAMRDSGSVAYPSQIFIMIAIIWIFSKIMFSKAKPIEYFLFVYFVIASLSTNTRGLIISMMICILLLLIINASSNRNKSKFILISIALFVLILIFSQYLNISRIFSFSDEVGGKRIVYIIEGIRKLFSNPFVLLFGAGYGAELKSSGSANIEISFLEILVEQGFMGVILWILYLLSSLKSIYASTKNKTISLDIGNALLISIVSIILISFTNPYINNTVGMLMCFIVLLVFKHEKEAEIG